MWGAWTTARVVAQALGYPPEFLQREAELYLASEDDILDVVLAQDNGFGSIMVVGHNPGLTDLANWLVPGLTNNLPTAGYVACDIECDDWNLRKRKGTTLRRYDFPKNRDRSV